MGVLGLWQLLAPVGQPVTLESLENKIFSVDISIWLNQAVKGYRDSTGGSVPNAHLLSLFSRLCKLLFYRIHPIIVFDGGFPELKKQTIINRQQRRAAVKHNSREVGLKILSNYLASQQLGQGASTSSGSKVSFKHKEKPRDEIFKLPPLPENLQGLSEAQESEEIESKFSNFSKEDIKYLNQIDIESDDFHNLPPKVKLEILSTLKESRRHRTWQQFEELPKEYNDFSKYQMQALLKKRKLQGKLEQVQKDLRRINSSAYVSQYTNDHVIGETNKIMSDDSSYYVLLKKITEKGNDQDTNRDDNSSLYVMNDVKNAFIRDIENIDVGDDSFKKEEEDLNQAILNSLSDVKKDKDSLDFEDEFSVDNPPTFSESNEASIAFKKIDGQKINLSNIPLLNKDSSQSSNSQNNTLCIVEENFIKETNMNESGFDVEIVDKKPAQKKVLDEVIVSSDDEILCCNEDKTVEKPVQKKALDEVVVSSDDEMVSCDDEKIIGEKPNFTDDILDSYQASEVCSPMVENNEQFNQPLNPKIMTTFLTNNDASLELPSTSVLTFPSASNENPASNVKSSSTSASEDDEMVPALDEDVLRPSEILSNSPKIVDKDLLAANRELQQELETAASILEAEQAKQDRQARTVQDHMIEECKELLQLFGIPYIVSPLEAEAQCAFYDKVDLTHGTITDDSDVWLFGGKRVYKNFFTQQKFVECYKDQDIFHHFGLSREKLIDFALLTGSDYTEGIEGVGPVTAMEIISEFPGVGIDSLQKFKKWWEDANKQAKSPENKVRAKLKKLVLSNTFPEEIVFNAYLDPEVDSSVEKFTWGRPDLDALREYTKERFGWNQSKVDDALLPVLKKLNERNSQTHIDSFFSVSLRKEKNLFPSKRIMSALKKITSPQKSDTDNVKNKPQKRKAGTSRKKGKISKAILEKTRKNCKSQGPNLSESSSDSDR